MNFPSDPSTVRIRLDLAYDGTDYSGWAIQPGLRTVQGELESSLGVLLRATPDPRLTVGGRTDAGVHARGQVAHLDVTPEQLARWTGRVQDGRSGELSEAETARLRARRLNGLLNRTTHGIAVHSARVVPKSFDARFSALRRRYEYRLRGSAARRDPLTSRFTVDVAHHLDISVLQRAADELIGLNDFTSFCKAREGSTAVRDLLCFEWRVTEDGAFAARIEADAFCHSMVRAMVGAVVAVATERIDLSELIQLRDARKRTSQFAVLPAHGLSLEEIAYPADSDLGTRAELTRRRRYLDDD